MSDDGRLRRDVMRATLKSVADSVGTLKTRVDTLATSLATLTANVDERFQQFDARFAQVDARFEQVDARFQQVDARFQQVDARFEQVDARFEQVDRRFDGIEERITTEGEAVRRYFDERIQGVVDDMRRYFEIVAEQMKAERNLVLDGGLAAAQDVERLRGANAAAHAGFEKTLADHDIRLRRLESK